MWCITWNNIGARAVIVEYNDKRGCNVPRLFSNQCDAQNALELEYTHMNDYDLRVDEFTPDLVKWREREQERIDNPNSEYAPLPWLQEEFWLTTNIHADHFAHIAIKDPTKIAYTESPMKGARDLQTVTTPGRYLQKFMPWLGTEQIRDIAMRWSLKYADGPALKFAVTPDEIEEVYLKGPTSCMSKKLYAYGSRVHPVRVYGAGDIHIAYLEDPLRGDKVTARAVCVPTKLEYGRLYGDEHRLREALTKAGWSYSADCLREQRLLLEYNDDETAFVAPYLDGNYTDVSIRGKYLVIGGGDFALQNTDGLVPLEEEEPEPDWCCDRCGEGHFNDDTSYEVVTRLSDGGTSRRTETWCSYCQENHTFFCDAISEYVTDSYDSVEMSGGETWSLRYFESNGFHSDHSDENFSCDDETAIVVPWLNGCEETWTKSEVMSDLYDDCDVAYIGPRIEEEMHLVEVPDIDQLQLFPEAAE